MTAHVKPLRATALTTLPTPEICLRLTRRRAKQHNHKSGPKALVGGLWPAFRVKQCTGHVDKAGSLRRIRHCSPRRTSSTWVPPARQRRGSSSPGCRELSSFEDRAPRSLERTSQDQATRFPVELPRGASQPRPALHEWHQMLAQASSGDRSISVPTPAALAICSGEPHVSRETTRDRGTYGLRFHKGAHICGQPLSVGEVQSTELYTTVDKLRSALWPAPMARDHPPVRGRRGAGEGAAEGRGRQVRPHREHRTELTHIASMADPCVL